MKHLTIPIIKYQRGTSVPYSLLLLADPDKSLVDQYLAKGMMYLAQYAEKTIGVMVLLPHNSATIEIKNIAVDPEFQRQGIGKRLLHHACSVATKEGYKSISIATANSSLAPLQLYQQSGFQIIGVQKDFFIKNYSEPIFENGMQATDLIILEKQL